MIKLLNLKSNLLLVNGSIFANLGGFLFYFLIKFRKPPFFAKICHDFCSFVAFPYPNHNLEHIYSLIRLSSLRKDRGEDAKSEKCAFNLALASASKNK